MRTVLSPEVWAAAGENSTETPSGATSSAALPTLLAAWLGMYTRGKALMPVVALGTASAYGVATYASSTAQSSWLSGFVGAGALTLAIVPFTLIAMARTNGRLLAAAARANGEGSSRTFKPLAEADAKALLKSWAELNLVRAMFPLAAAAVGTWTLLG